MSSDKLKVYVLENGVLHMDKSWLTADATESPAKAGDSALQSTKAQLIGVPVYAVLIDSPDGFILFDAGCHPHSMGKDGRWPLSLQQAFPWSADESQYLLNRFEQLRLHPQDVRYVVASHLHCDHAGNLEFFSSAATIVHKWELEAAQRAFRAGIDDGEFVYEDMVAWHRNDVMWKTVGSSETSFELVSGVKIHNLGSGHSYGMLGLEVTLPGTGTIFLASDAAYSSYNYGAEATAPKAVYDVEGYLRGIQKIEGIAAQTNGQVWMGHDMPQYQTLLKVPHGCYL